MNLKSLFRKKSVDLILSQAHLEQSETAHYLAKNLNVRDLTGLGIAAIIGAGIFSTIGNAASSGGPAISLLFIFTAVACGFSAMCYAHFTALIPVSGSAYTYAYATFGELIAWIIGWDLLMEYAIGNIAVAISWSDYFTALLKGFHIHIPDYLTMDYVSAMRGHREAAKLINEGQILASETLQQSNNAWQTAPKLFGIRLILDLPALCIVTFITWLVFVGIKESKTASNIFVIIKLAVIFLVIVAGSFYVNPDNWSPFAPNGISGVLKGVSAVFFAYIGFDAISTTAEECKNPKRDLPRSMIYSLIICTALYVVLSLVLTGMVHFEKLAVGDPLAFAFEQVGLNTISGVVAVSAVVAMASVLLVFQMGQPRIWMSMSRDGLLPKRFSKIHPKYKTPSFSTVVTGLLVGIPALFMNLTEVTDLTSIGTLFAFVLVCGGVLLLKPHQQPENGRFKVPYINSKFLLPLIFAAVVVFVFISFPDYVGHFYTKAEGESWAGFLKDRAPHYLFFLAFVALSITSFFKNLSLIPVLGLLSNLYLMTELHVSNWLRFLIWLAVGLLIYFLYGYRKSKLKHQ